MKDLKSSSFGIVIAFVLPGLAAFYSLKFWSTTVEEIFRTFLTTEANVGLFFLVFAAAVVLSLQVTLVRWIVFEKIICKTHNIGPDYFKGLGLNEHRLTAFRAVVDEHYRYHQFWGGIAVVFPAFVIGWFYQNWAVVSTLQFYFYSALAMALEVLTGCAAYAAYKLYSDRAKEILSMKLDDNADPQEPAIITIATEILKLSADKVEVSTKEVAAGSIESDSH